MTFIDSGIRERLGPRLLGPKRVLLALLQNQTGAVTVALGLLLVTFSVLLPASFATRNNGVNLALDASSILLVAAGTTYVLIAGGLDLSIGSVVVFSSVASAKVMTGRADTWTTVLVGLGVAVAVGAAWGALNGFFIVRLGLPALIVTLATLSIGQGGAERLAGDQDIPNMPGKLVNGIGIGRFLGIPYIVWIPVAVTLVLGLILAFTRFGSRTYAIGSREQAALRAGINVRRHTFVLYVQSGALAGLSGFLGLTQFGTTSLDGYTFIVIAAITAVVLGGVSLFGGTGGMLGTVVGVFIPVAIASGFAMLGLPSSIQQVFVGCVLIFAVYLDKLRRRSRDAGWLSVNET
jgi:ribose transport system permease protein